MNDRMQRAIHMRKITLFVAGVALGIVISIGTWIAVGTLAPTSALARFECRSIDDIALRYLLNHR